MTLINVTPDLNSATHTDYGTEADATDGWSILSCTSGVLSVNSSSFVNGSSSIGLTVHSSGCSYLVELDDTVPSGKDVSLSFYHLGGGLGLGTGKTVTVRANNMLGQVLTSGTMGSLWKIIRSSSVTATADITSLCFSFETATFSYNALLDALYVVYDDGNEAPTQSTDLRVNSESSPDDVVVFDPQFDFVFNDPNKDDFGKSYQIQLNTSIDFSGSLIWDSGKQDFAEYSPGVLEGTRCDPITYSTTLTELTTYYWRVKTWDDDDTEGVWSEIETFQTYEIPIVPTELRVNGEINPKSTSIEFGVVFNFIFNHAVKNAKGEKYQIQVGTTINGFDMWDSGWVDFSTQPDRGEKCEDITYAGSTLSNNQRYYIRARTDADQSPEISGWSEVFEFVTEVRGVASVNFIPPNLVLEDELLDYFCELLDYVLYHHHQYDTKYVEGKFDINSLVFDRDRIFHMLDGGTVSDTLTDDLLRDEINSYALFLSNILEFKGTKAALTFLEGRLGLSASFQEWWEMEGQVVEECGVYLTLTVPDDYEIPPWFLEDVQDLFDRLMWVCALPRVSFKKEFSETVTMSDSFLWSFCFTDYFPNWYSQIFALCPDLPSDWEFVRIGDFNVSGDPNPVTTVYDEASTNDAANLNTKLIIGLDEDKTTYAEFSGAAKLTATGFRVTDATGAEMSCVVRFRTTDEGFMISQGDDTLGTFIFSVEVNSAAKVEINISDTGAFPGGAAGKRYFVGTGVNDGDYHTVAFRWESSTLDVWFDGTKNPASLSKDLDNAFSNLYTTTTPDVLMGCIISNGTSSEFFTGDLGDVILWNSGLSDANMTKAIDLKSYCPPTGVPTPVARWAMNEILSPENYVIIGASCTYDHYLELCDVQACDDCADLFVLDDLEWDSLAITATDFVPDASGVDSTCWLYYGAATCQFYDIPESGPDPHTPYAIGHGSELIITDKGWTDYSVLYAET